jgi:hypothetical protein
VLDLQPNQVDGSDADEKAADESVFAVVREIDNREVEHRKLFSNMMLLKLTRRSSGMEISNSVRSIVVKLFIHPLSLLTVVTLLAPSTSLLGRLLRFSIVILVVCQFHISMKIHYLHLSAMYKGLCGIKNQVPDGKIREEAKHAALTDPAWIVSCVMAGIGLSQSIGSVRVQ